MVGVGEAGLAIPDADVERLIVQALDEVSQVGPKQLGGLRQAGYG